MRSSTILIAGSSSCKFLKGGLWGIGGDRKKVGVLHLCASFRAFIQKRQKQTKQSHFS